MEQATKDNEGKLKLAEIQQGMKILRVNIGAGLRPDSSGFWRNQDLYPGKGIDDVFDLCGPWPYLDGTVRDIVGMHVIEHLKDPVACIAEGQRVLESGGHMLLRMPYGATDAAMFDITHQRPFYASTFFMFTPRVQDGSFNPQHEGSIWPNKFLVEEIRYVISDEVSRWPLKWLWRSKLEWLRCHWQNIIAELWVKLHRLSDEDVQKIQNQKASFEVHTHFVNAKECAAMPMMGECRFKEGI